MRSASQKIELGANYRSLISIFLEPNSETGTGSRIFQAFINLLGQLGYRFAITLIDLSLALRKRCQFLRLTTLINLMFSR